MMGKSAQGRGLRFNMFDVTVTFDPLMLVFVVAISFASGDRAATLVAFSALFFSVLVHEFGHAIAFARHGMRPEIRLHMFGGVTYAQGGLDWKQRIGVSLAGPAAGFVLGFSVLGLESAGMTPEFGLGGVAVRMLVFANLIWGLVNLLPMLPLDGGHVVEAVLVHTRGEAGWKATRYISIFVGVTAALAVLALSDRGQIAALIAAYFTFSTWKELGARSEGRVNELLGQARAAQRSGNHPAVIQITFDALGLKHSKDQARWLRAIRTASLLELGRAEQARQELVGLPRATRGFWAWAAVEQVTGTPEDARAALIELLRSGEPMWPGLWEHVTVDPAAVDAIADELIGDQPTLTVQALDTLQRLQGRHGDHLSSIQVGVHAWDVARSPQAAVEIACSYVRLDNRNAAQTWLERAVAAGFDDRDLLMSDPVLAPMRDSEAFQQLLREIPATET